MHVLDQKEQAVVLLPNSLIGSFKGRCKKYGDKQIVKNDCI